MARLPAAHIHGRLLPSLAQATNLTNPTPTPDGCWARGGAAGGSALPHRRLRAAGAGARPEEYGVRPRPMFFHCHLLPLRLVQSHRAKVLPLALLLSLFSGVDDGDARGEQEQFLDLGGAKDLVGSSVFFWLYKVFCASWWTAVPVLVSYVPVFVRSCVCSSSGIIQVRKKKTKGAS